MKKIKRIFLIFISVCIFGITIYSDYQTVKAVDIPTAFWGTLEAARAFWTALNAGGGVRGGGVSTATFEHSSREDMHELQVQVMLAYTAFCIWKEKTSLKLAHPDWSEDEIDQQAEVNGRLASDRFQNSAINVTDTTKDLTIKDYGYWKEFCNRMNSIAINGIGVNEDIGFNTKVNVPIYNYGSPFEVDNHLSNIFGYTVHFQDHNYVYKGNFVRVSRTSNGLSYTVEEIDVSSTDSSRVIIPFIEVTYDNYNRRIIYRLRKAHFNILTGKYISYSDNGYVMINGLDIASDLLNLFIEHCNFPLLLCQNTNVSDAFNDTVNYNIDKLAVDISVSSNELYEEQLNDALNNTEAGKAIKEGAKDGQEEIIKEGYVPVKRSTVRSGEETATGEVGWDVPDARTLEGSIAVPDTQDDVVEGMGVISVPEDVVRPKDDDTVAEWAKDEPISIPDTKDEPISKPIDDVISDQYGDYYPTQISLGDFFPFCIPFDIYYCVQKFNVGQGEAPIIHIPIVYPRALQGALGESYDVIIDFNNYIALRNIIRAFILIFFLIGLMQVTRNLIRG